MKKQVVPLFEYKLEMTTKYSLGFKFLYLRDETLKPENFQCSRLNNTIYQNKITTEWKNTFLFIYTAILAAVLNPGKGQIQVIMNNAGAVLWVKGPLTFTFPDVNICRLIVKTTLTHTENWQELIL